MAVTRVKSSRLAAGPGTPGRWYHATLVASGLVSLAVPMVPVREIIKNVDLITFLRRFDADPGKSLPGRDCGEQSIGKMREKE